jgi:eukaryotic-like serine/threonine-protein kinase
LIFYRTNDDYILQQEARILSSLNHPNLLAIFDVGSQDGSHYLVSELLEDKTLRERLSVGPLSLRKAVEYGVQMANGCRMSLSYILSRIHVH